jgi:hypothetical protein
MKKVSLLILIILVLSTVLMAAIPTKMVRLTVINKSDPGTGSGDFAVYMKLTGSGVTNAFYYLTVPSGSKDTPMIKVFTVMQDVYSRETWQCNGVRSTGSLVVDGNIRLTFVPCGQFACAWTSRHFELMGCAFGPEMAAWSRANCLGLTTQQCRQLWNLEGGAGSTLVLTTKRFAGEPRMEKVTYFKYLTQRSVVGLGSALYLQNGFFNFGCFTFAWRIRTYRLPLGCAWRYQY